MSVLNLTDGFYPLGRTHEVEYKKFKFPSGETHFQLLSIPFDGTFNITVRVTSADELMLLFLAVDTIRSNFGEIPISVFIPFLPYARQDRVNEPGECFSLKTLATLLNSYKLTKVTIFDVHSDVSTAVLNNAAPVSNSRFVQSVLLSKRWNYTLVCPDMGAYKKVYKVAKELGYQKDILLCNKVRNTVTGKVSGTELLKPLPKVGETYYIVDDICDGGATFIGIAEAIHAQDQTAIVNLIVSHGIFSKGIDHLVNNGISEVYTTDSFKDQLEHPNLHTTKLSLGIL
jgi:ribose-phosphate pyrophosphokinase